MSFGFQLPEEDARCECKYDEIHDRMDRDDCPFHCDEVEDHPHVGVLQTVRKPAASDSGVALTQKRGVRNC